MTQARKQKIRDELKRQRRRRVLATTTVVAVAMIAIVLVLIFLQSKPLPTGSVGSPISQDLYANLSGVSATTLNSVGNGGTGPLTSVSGQPLTSGGKPEFLYIGADYCPFCAAERWSVIVALAKFGSFSGLTYMLSAPPPETSPNTATFSFHGSTYTSQYVAFVGVEIQDRNRGTLDILTSDQTSIMRQYDSGQNIPFVDINNQYVKISSQYSPDLLSGMNWTQIGSQLDNPSSPVATNIDGGANMLITAICKADGGQPSSVCQQSYAKQFLAAPSPGQFNAANPLFSPPAQDMTFSDGLEKLSREYQPLLPAPRRVQW